MSVAITRKFYTYSGSPIDDGVIVKAQLWYKHVSNSPLVGSVGVINDGNRTFTVVESGLYYFYIGVGDDDLMYDPMLDEVFEAESYGSDANDGVYLVKNVPLPTSTSLYLWSNLAPYLKNRVSFGNNMSSYEALIMIRTVSTYAATHSIVAALITDAHVSFSIEPNATYSGGFYIDVAFIRE